MRVLAFCQAFNSWFAQILSKHYILKENLDQAIEHALANPVDYNFAIDLQHNILLGRVTDTTSATSVATENKVEAITSA